MMCLRKKVQSDNRVYGVPAVYQASQVACEDRWVAGNVRNFLRLKFDYPLYDVLFRACPRRIQQHKIDIAHLSLEKEPRNWLRVKVQIAESRVRGVPVCVFDRPLIRLDSGHLFEAAGQRKGE